MNDGKDTGNGMKHPKYDMDTLRVNGICSRGKNAILKGNRGGKWQEPKEVRVKSPRSNAEAQYSMHGVRMGASAVAYFKMGGYSCCLENRWEMRSNFRGRNFLDKLWDSFCSVEERSVSLIFEFLKIGPGLLLVCQAWFWNFIPKQTVVELICSIVMMKKQHAWNSTLIWS